MRVNNTIDCRRNIMMRHIINRAPEHKRKMTICVADKARVIAIDTESNCDSERDYD